MKKLLLFTCLLFLTTHLLSQPLRLAVYQYADNPRIKNLQPLANRLQQQLPVTTEVKSYPTVHALITAIQQNEVDLAFISTFGYLLLQAGTINHPMVPLATLTVPAAKDNYKTAIISSRKSGIAELAHLKQSGTTKQIAFVATGSTSGNLVPRLLLNGLGIDPETHFSSVRYAGTHAKALGLLQNDSVDIAAMGSTEWDKLDQAQKSSMNLLWLSSEIPLGPVMVNKAVDAGSKKKLAKILLNLHRTDSASLEAIKAAWSEAKQATHFIAIDKDYYAPYLKQFGTKRAVEATIKKFIQ